MKQVFLCFVEYRASTNPFTGVNVNNN